MHALRRRASRVRVHARVRFLTVFFFFFTSHRRASLEQKLFGALRYKNLPASSFTTSSPRRRRRRHRQRQTPPRANTCTTLPRDNSRVGRTCTESPRYRHPVRPPPRRRASTTDFSRPPRPGRRRTPPSSPPRAPRTPPSFSDPPSPSAPPRARRTDETHHRLVRRTRTRRGSAPRLGVLVPPPGAALPRAHPPSPPHPPSPLSTNPNTPHTEADSHRRRV